MPKKRKVNNSRTSTKTVPFSTPKTPIPKEIANKPFWAFLIIIFLSSFLTLTTITEDNSQLTGNLAIQVISYQPAGSDLFFEIRNVKNLKDATATISDTIKNGKIIFEEPKLPPSFDGTLLSAFTIESPDAAKIQQLIITLKIKQSDIAAAKLLPAEVLVYYGNQPLVTTLSHSKDDYVYYTTTTTTLGTFAIGKQTLKLPPPQPPAITPQPQEETITPPSTPIEPTPQTPPATTTITAQPATEQQPLPPIEQQPHPIETPQPPPKPTIWQKIKDFFKNLI